MQVKSALQQGSRLLEKSAIPHAHLTAELLLCHALGRERPYLYSHSDDEVTPTQWLHYGRYLYQRMAGEPLQYITRRQEFYGRPFRVSPAVLIPRPETEHLIETALEIQPRPRRTVDVGCGSGAIAITWRKETGGETVATDISPEALAVAQDNAQRLEARVEFVCCDLASALAARQFDLVLCNPPYIPDGEGPSLQREVRDHEPAVALFSGPTGVEVYQRLIADAPRLLRPGGHLVVEVGYQGMEQVRAMLGEPWREIVEKRDLAGWPRVLSAQYAP